MPPWRPRSISPMRSPLNLTDTDSLGKHRRRARAEGRNDAMFLHSQVQDEIRVRLEELDGRFAAAALVSGFPEFWKGAFETAELFPDREILGAPASRFDLFIHAMALHWSNDPVGQLIQCRMALRPGGLFLCALLGGATLQELRQSIAEAEVFAAGGASPRVAPMGDIRDLGNLLQRAGFIDAVADSITVKATYSSALELMRDLRSMGETNALAERKTEFASKKLFLECARIYAERFSAPDGRIPATFELIFLTARAPRS